MSNAKKCDRCGAFYEPHKANFVLFNQKRIVCEAMDLCPVCSDSLESWFTLRPKEAEDEPEEEQSSRDDNI